MRLALVVACALLLSACSALGLYTGKAVREAIVESGGDPDVGMNRAAEITDSWWWQLLATALGGGGLAVGYQRLRPSRAHRQVIELQEHVAALEAALEAAKPNGAVP